MMRVLGTSRNPYDAMNLESNRVQVPVPPHHGAFGAVRKHDVHQGVDLYCPKGTPIYAVEPGRVTQVEQFTGAAVGSPWWLDTVFVAVEGASGVVVYGEIDPAVSVGDEVGVDTHVGNVKRVLRKDKGWPTCIFHLELHKPGSTISADTDWTDVASPPPSLLDPTGKLNVAFDRTIASAARGIADSVWYHYGKSMIGDASSPAVLQSIRDHLFIIVHDELKVRRSAGR